MPETSNRIFHSVTTPAIVKKDKHDHVTGEEGEDGTCSLILRDGPSFNDSNRPPTSRYTELDLSTQIIADNSRAMNGTGSSRHALVTHLPSPKPSSPYHTKPVVADSDFDPEVDKSRRDKECNIGRSENMTETPSCGPRPALPFEVKGCKVTYDPDLDKKTTAKDKKRKLQSLEFTQTDTYTKPADPRLSIANYVRGSANKLKVKMRLTPYSIRHWQFDAATSIGRAAPSQVVVTGFDALTPIAPINALFASFGEVAHIDNRTDPVTGRPLGICLVKFKDTASFQNAGPLSASAAARRAYYECKKEQRIGTRRIRVELDRDGLLSQRLVDKAVESWRKTNQPSLEGSRHDTPTANNASNNNATNNNEPPPTAPKGPSGRSSVRPTFNPPEGPKASIMKPATPSLIEEIPILQQIKRDPYIFIAHCYVPVLGSTISHLQKRLRTFDWKAVRCDKTGYYIIFENSRRGEEETMRCYKMCHMTPLFTYIMNMESQPYGNPNYERSPSPERLQAEQKAKAEKERVLREQQLETDEEKQQRARNLDPSKEVLSIVIRELKTKLLEDVKFRIAAPFLYEYLDPDRHSSTRKALGIQDPQANRPNPFQPGIPNDSLHSGPLDLLALPRIRKSHRGQLGRATYLDERRGHVLRRRDVRPLHHRLRHLHEAGDSDDDARTPMSGDTDDLGSRSPSRLSFDSLASDTEDDDYDIYASKSLSVENEPADYVITADVDTKEDDDLMPQQIDLDLSVSPKKRKRILDDGLDSRKRHKDDHELLGVETVVLDVDGHVHSPRFFDSDGFDDDKFSLGLYTIPYIKDE
jgi:[histone H3]-lysine4 N-trimethyltransferase SETD1